MKHPETILSAIQNAEQHISRLTPEALGVPGFTSIKIRHLLNNLGLICHSFIECGSHKGGTFCSTVFANDHLKQAVAIDDFSEFNNDDPMAELLANVAEFKPGSVPFKLIKQDCWSDEVKKELAGMKFDLYTYDGAHDYESQRRAITQYLDFMDDEFILVVDDYSTWDQVKKGTKDGIQDSGCSIVFERELYNGIPGDNFAWHNGIGLFLLRKP